MEMIEEVPKIAQGITDLGMMVIVAAFFLILSALLWVACFRWFKSLINNMIADNGKMVSELLAETRKQNDMLTDISEGLRPETQLRIKNTAGVYFDLAVEKVCRIIKKVREENHIVNKEATTAKVHTLIVNLHEDRNSRFDCYSYRGRRLSCYANSEWVDWVQEVVLREVYDESVNHSRAFSNVQAVYERIKLDFYHRMNDL